MASMGNSRLSRISRDELESAISGAATMRDLVVSLGYSSSSGSMIAYLERRIRAEGLSLEHIRSASHTGEVERLGRHRYSLEEILVENSPYLNRYQLKVRLAQAGLLRQECYECGLPPEWSGKALTLQLDHINGVNDDNRIDNLRLLCPNCHSQTATHSGRNKRSGTQQVSLKQPIQTRRQPAKVYRCSCGAQISKTAERCRPCFIKSRERTSWPAHSDLLELVERVGFVKAGESLGVSDNAVRQRIRANVRLNRVA